MDVCRKPVRCKRVGADEHSLGFLAHDRNEQSCH